ncbi:MAG TPA: ABC transporter permease [Tepidisphaeraceae bacterium]|nr:ABC transporter permease [Tepidisphaeraceae bacterium]
MTLEYASRPTLVFRAKRLIPGSFIDAMVITFVALIISLLLFGLFVTISKGINIWTVYEYLFRGAFGKASAWRNTMIHAAPLLLTALAVALPARVGMMIIGGEGCVLLGALIAALVAHLMPGMPAILVQISMVVGGMVMGGIWVSIAGALRQYRGVNETISSLLLNYIARAILNHCVEGPMHDPNNLNVPSTWPLDPHVMFGNIPGTEIHIGLIFGILACIFCWILMDHTTYGFATRIVGGNVRAAKVAGLSVAKYSLGACFLGGAFAGLAGVVEVAARDGFASDNLSQGGYGYAGILVAFVARQNPLAIIPVAILMGGVNNDFLKMKLESDSCVQVFQGILFLVILGLDTWAGRLKDVRNIWFARLIGRLVYGVKRPTSAKTGVANVNA